MSGISGNTAGSDYYCRKTFNEWQSSGGGEPSDRTVRNNAGNWTLRIPTTNHVVNVGTGFDYYPVISETDPIIDILNIEPGANVTLADVMHPNPPSRQGSTTI